MSDNVRVGIAQWTPGRDRDGNMRTAEALAKSGLAKRFVT